MAMATRDLVDLLPAYSEGWLDDAQVSDVQALLTGYIDGLLDPETEAAIDRAIEDHPGLALDVDKARSGKDILAKIFPPSDEPLEDPDSPEIQQFLDDLFAKPHDADQPAEENVVELPRPAPSRHKVWYALAASIAIVAIGAGAWFTHGLQGRLDQALTDQADLQAAIDKIEAERTALDQQTAGLQAELEASTERLEALETERSTLAGAVERLTDTLERTEVARDIAQAAAAEAADEQASLHDDLSRLSAELAQSEEAQSAAVADLSDAENMIVDLRTQRQTLDKQIAGLEAEALGSANQRQAVDAERGVLAADVKRLQTKLASALSAREATKATLLETEARLAALTDDIAKINRASDQAMTAKRVAEAKLAETKATVEALQGKRDALAEQVASLGLEAESRIAALATARQQLANLQQDLQNVQTNWSDAQKQIADQAIERAQLDRIIAALHLRQEWTFQVAQYHQRFAQQPKRRWVDAAKNEPERLQAMLADLGREFGLDRPLPLPEALDRAGLTFMGARQLVINGASVAQLVYADQQKELLAFCVTRNMSGEEKGLTGHRVGDDLFLVDWNDRGFQYVVVGYEPIGVIRTLAEQLQQSYEL